MTLRVLHERLALAALLAMTSLTWTGTAAAGTAGDPVPTTAVKAVAMRPVKLLRGAGGVGAQSLMAGGTVASGAGATTYVPGAVGPAKSTWQVAYNGFTPSAQVAFDAAVNYWAGIITSSVPIKVTASFQPTAPGVLGQASPSAGYSGPGIGDGSSVYPAALADALTGRDVSASSGPAVTDDIQAVFSSTETGIYYGTDGQPPAGTIDFETVVLHELGHGLGFTGSMSVSGGVGSYTAPPEIYDRFTASASSTALLSFPNNSTALADALQAPPLQWTGTNAVSANGGQRPVLYAPAHFSQGSSYSHLDESTYPAGNINSLMTPSLNAQEVIRDPGPVAVGIMNDLGWQASRPSDTTPPQLVSAQVSPTAVAVGTRAQVVTVTAHVTDDLSGSQAPTATITDPGGGRLTTGPMTLASGSTLDGWYRGQVTVPAGAPSGTWPVDLEALRDRAGNTAAAGTRIGALTVADTPSRVPWKVAVGRSMPSGYTLFLAGSSSDGGAPVSSVAFGAPGDVALVGDWNGDGTATVGIWRPSEAAFYLADSNVAGGGNVIRIAFGNSDDLPLVAHLGGAKDTVAVFRPSTGTFFLAGDNVAGGGAVTAVAFGSPGDLPLLGDWTGTGQSRVGVFRPREGRFFLAGSNVTGGGVVSTFGFGSQGDLPIAGDWDADGQAEVAVFRPSQGRFFLAQSNASGGGASVGTFLFGSPGDTPAAYRP